MSGTDWEGAMFSFKEIKKVIAAAVVLSAIAVYASPSFALEVNCDGKTGQELKNCEELKALAEKGNKKAEEKTNEKSLESRRVLTHPLTSTLSCGCSAAKRLKIFVLFNIFYSSLFHFLYKLLFPV